MLILAFMLALSTSVPQAKPVAPVPVSASTNAQRGDATRTKSLRIDAERVERERQRRHDDRMYHVSRATAIFTGIYMLLTLFIWFSMLSANRKTEAALTETRRSNELTGETIETMQLAHRPSLHVEELMLVSGSSNADSEVTMRVVLRNTGTDTAQAVMTFTNMRLAPAPTREELDRETPVNKEADVGVGMTLYVEAKRPRDSFLGTAVSTDAFVFTLIVTYRDEFRNHYRMTVVRRLKGNDWETVDEWQKRTKITPETSPR